MVEEWIRKSDDCVQEIETNFQRCNWTADWKLVGS